MAKITMHKGVMGVVMASDKNGKELVDPSYHADHANLPEDALDGAKLFHEKVVSSPTGHRLRQTHLSDDEYDAGATSKTFLKVPAWPADKKWKKAVPNKIFMVKPYWEDLSDWRWSYYPLGGWSEMAFQGLMHAGNIGHMSQRVHTFRINDKNKTPMLAVEIEKGVHAMSNANNYAGNYFGKDGEDFGAVEMDEDRRHDAAKLATLDFLTNNQDRHDSNLMFRVDVDHNDEKATMTDLLAIDQGRAFQYRAPLRFAGDYQAGGDHVVDYLMAPAYEMFQLEDPKIYQVVADWWKDNRKAIVKEFSKHIAQIKDPHAYRHIKDNFLARAKIMDKFVKVHKDLSKGKHSRARAQADAAVSHYIPEHQPHERYPYSDSE